MPVYGAARTLVAIVDCYTTNVEVAGTHATANCPSNYSEAGTWLYTPIEAKIPLDRRAATVDTRKASAFATATTGATAASANHPAIEPLVSSIERKWKVHTTPGRSRKVLYIGPRN